MKKKCTHCNKTYYPSENNSVGYPRYFEGNWYDENGVIDNWSSDKKLEWKYNKTIKPENRFFCTKSCLEKFFYEHQIYLNEVITAISFKTMLSRGKVDRK